MLPIDSEEYRAEQIRKARAYLVDIGLLEDIQELKDSAPKPKQPGAGSAAAPRKCDDKPRELRRGTRARPAAGTYNEDARIRKMMPAAAVRRQVQKGASKKPRVEKEGNDGTTCHWCRQKNMDFKVTCTSEQCGVGSNGNQTRQPVSFCGRCLRNRNGEDAKAAAASGNWKCPVCRGSCGEGCKSCCNCGPCRRKVELSATHRMVPQARKQGFDNVHDYLVYLENGSTQAQLHERKVKMGGAAWMVKAQSAESGLEEEC